MTKDNGCAVSLLGNQFKLKEEAQIDSRRKAARKNGNEKLPDSLWAILLKCGMPENVERLKCKYRENQVNSLKRCND